MIKSCKQLHEVLPKHTRILNMLSPRLPHYSYPQDSLQSICYQHREPLCLKDKIAYMSIRAIRGTYDWITRYNESKMTEKRWISRCLVLETLAGVPGMVGAMCRHLRSLRKMERDNGWIHHLIEEADNERFHLMTFVNLRQPSLLERSAILALQGLFMNSFFVAYLCNARFCHKFVGYLEEEAVKTYSSMIKAIETPGSAIHHWGKTPAPKEAIEYYDLSEDATLKDVIYCIRADEACHRDANHFFAEAEPDYKIEEQGVTIINKRLF